MDHQRNLGSRLSRNCSADGNRVSLYSVAVGSHHAVLGRTDRACRGELVQPRPVFIALGGDVWSHWLQLGLDPGVRNRILRRAPTGTAVWALHFRDSARTEHRRSILRAVGIVGGADRALAAGDPNIYRTACRDCANAAASFPRVHVYRIVAVVLCAGVRRDAAGRAVGQGPAIEALVASHGWRDSR